MSPGGDDLVGDSSGEAAGGAAVEGAVVAAGKVGFRMETAFGDRVHQLIALKLMGFDSSRIGRLVGDSDEAHWRKAESILATPPVA